MTGKARSLAVPKAPVTEGIEGHVEEKQAEPTSGNLLKYEAGKDVGASRDNGSPGGGLKDRKALKPNFRPQYFVYTLLAVAAWLLSISAVNKFRPVLITQSCPSASLIMENDDDTTSLASRSRNTDSSSSTQGSYVTPVSEYLKLCLSPPDVSLMSTVSSACSCLLGAPIERTEFFSITVVGNPRESFVQVRVLLISLLRQRLSSQRVFQPRILLSHCQSVPRILLLSLLYNGSNQHHSAVNP